MQAAEKLAELLDTELAVETSVALSQHKELPSLMQGNSQHDLVKGAGKRVCCAVDGRKGALDALV